MSPEGAAVESVEDEAESGVLLDREQAAGQTARTATSNAVSRSAKLRRRMEGGASRDRERKCSAFPPARYSWEQRSACAKARTSSARNTSGFTRCGTGSPRTAAMAFRAASSAMRPRASTVALPRCGSEGHVGLVGEPRGQLGLALVDVESRPCQVATLQRVHQRRLVDDRTSAPRSRGTIPAA